MYIPLGIKSDFSLLKSLIKIPDLINYLHQKQITTVGLLDDNLFGSICFYNSCIKNDIKPIIGLALNISQYNIYLYAKNYNGFQNLLKINTLIQQKELNYVDLKSYKKDLICVLPYKSKTLFEEFKEIFEILFIGYSDDFEKNNAAIITEKIVYLNEVRVFSFKDVKYLSILEEISTGEKGSGRRSQYLKT